MVSVVRNRREYDNIILFLQNKDDEVILQKDEKKWLMKKSKNFIILNGQLFLRDEENLHKRVLCEDEKDVIELEAIKFHKTNHFGVNRFEALCKEHFFKIPRDIIRKVVSECNTCMQGQPLKVKETQKHITASRPMERLMIDLIDIKIYKSSNSGYAWILTIIDVYSKFGWAFPLKAKSGMDVSSTLSSLFFMLGPPQIFQSDNGEEFINKEMDALIKEFDISFLHSRPRHPQTQGQVERFNQTLTRSLQKFIYEESEGHIEGDKVWTKYLSRVVYMYNLAKHSATRKTPFKLFLQIPGCNTKLGDPLNKDLEVEDCVPQKIEDLESLSHFEPSISQSYLTRMDKHSCVHVSKYDFEVGDKVFVSLDFDNNTKTKKKKLSSFYSQKSEIIELIVNNRAKITIGDKIEVVHLSRIKKSFN